MSRPSTDLSVAFGGSPPREGYWRARHEGEAVIAWLRVDLRADGTWTASAMLVPRADGTARLIEEVDGMLPGIELLGWVGAEVERPGQERPRYRIVVGKDSVIAAELQHARAVDALGRTSLTVRIEAGDPGRTGEFLVALTGRDYPMAVVIGELEVRGLFRSRWVTTDQEGEHVFQLEADRITGVKVAER